MKQGNRNGQSERWSHQEDEFLVEHYTTREEFRAGCKGMSAEQIGRRLGRSRCAVVGRWSRLQAEYMRNFETEGRGG